MVEVALVRARTPRESDGQAARVAARHIERIAPYLQLGKFPEPSLVHLGSGWRYLHNEDGGGIGGEEAYLWMANPLCHPHRITHDIAA